MSLDPLEEKQLQTFVEPDMDRELCALIEAMAKTSTNNSVVLVEGKHAFVFQMHHMSPVCV